MADQGTATAGSNTGGSCEYAGHGRGDCEHYIGLPGQSIPNQHDGPDDTVDVYGKPNGWCWQCWKSRQIADLQARLARLEDALRRLEGREAEYRRAHDMHGDGDSITGRAWDLMKRAGDDARAALSGTGEPVGGLSQTVADGPVWSHQMGEQYEADMCERAAAAIDNEHEIAKEKAREDGAMGAGFLRGLKYAAECIRALPLTEGKADDS